MQSKPKIIFMGTPNLAATVLEKLIESEIYKPALVITQPDKPVGRKQALTPPPVKALAEANGILVWQPKNLRDPEIIQKIKDEKPDLILVAAYGKIIPQEALDIPRFGALNVHGSLLPFLRGGSPVQTAILEDHKETGPTIMVVDAELDHGPVLAQKAFSIDTDDTAVTLMRKMAGAGADLLLKTLPLWLEEKIKPIKQEHAKATLTKIFQKEDGEIKPEMTAEYIERMTRAFDPWPGVCIELRIKNQESEKKMLKILKVKVLECKNDLSTLSFFLTVDKKLALQTAKDCLILEIVQPEGKKPMSGYDFYLGNESLVNASE